MTSDPVSPRKRDNEPGRQLSAEQAAAAAMVAEAKARGLELTGPNGLLKLFTKNVLETALNEELTEHLGHPKRQADPSRESTNVRNGSRSKTVISDAAGEVDRRLSRAQKQVTAAHARQRGPGERANAQLKSWTILRKIRSCPGRATALVKAVTVLIQTD
jgi:Transposase, Mutator family